MAREELKWQNIDADDLPAEVKKSFDAMVEAEAIHSITSSARARKVGGTSRPKRAAQRSVLADRDAHGNGPPRYPHRR